MRQCSRQTLPANVGTRFVALDLSSCLSARCGGGSCFLSKHGRPCKGRPLPGGRPYEDVCKRAVHCQKSPPAWHAAFEAMLPVIKARATFAFRKLDADAREEAMQETICGACQAYARLVERQKTGVATAGALARFAIRQTIEGRKVGGSLNCCDVMSRYCQRKKGITVESLHKYDAAEKCWLELLVEDKHAGPAETATARIDFSAWLQMLPRRLRKIATFLATGETTTAAAKRFRVSLGRISQLRGELHSSWQTFLGETRAAA